MRTTNTPFQISIAGIAVAAGVLPGETPSPRLHTGSQAQLSVGVGAQVAAGTLAVPVMSPDEMSSPMRERLVAARSQLAQELHRLSREFDDPIEHLGGLFADGPVTGERWAEFVADPEA